MVSSDRDEFNTNHPVYMRLYYLQHLYKVAEKLQNSKEVFPSELRICNFIEPVNYDEKMDSDFEVELLKINTSNLDQNLLYMLHELDVFMGLHLKLLKPTKLITKFYKKYVIDLLEIDKRVQKKTVTDRVTLDDLLGVIGKAYISYTKSPDFYKDMKRFLDHYLLKDSLLPTLCESPSKDIPLGKYIFDEIYPAAKRLYGDLTYNEMVNSSYSKLRKRIVFKNNDLLYCLLIEGLKIAFVHKFKYVIMTLLSNTDKYKAFKPFIVSNHAIVTNKLRVLYNNTTTIKKYISEHDKVAKELTNTPVDQTKHFGEIISDYCEKMKGIYHIKDSDGIPYSKHFENICKFKAFDEKETDMPTYRTSALTAMHNLRNTLSEELSSEENKLANCYNYNICDIVDDLFESKVSSTCYFDLSLYIRSRRKN